MCRSSSCGTDYSDCGCKYGCWGVFSNGACQWDACCTSAPSTCGCNNPILSGETCYDKTYYCAFPVKKSGTSYDVGTFLYIKYQFKNVLAVAGSVSHQEAHLNFFCWWWGYLIKNYISYSDLKTYYSMLSSTPSSSYKCIGTYTNPFVTNNSLPEYAEHCYMWVDELGDSMGDYDKWTNNNFGPLPGVQFSSYSLDDCSSKTPDATKAYGI
jgi:hypothetical protein